MTVYHASKILVSIESWKMLLIAAIKARIRKIYATGEIIIEVLIVAQRIIFTWCVHYLSSSRTIFTGK